jgi:hypothetical protein
MWVLVETELVLHTSTVNYYSGISVLLLVYKSQIFLDEHRGDR